MNRREFLLAVGATACSGNGGHVHQPPRPKRDASVEPDDAGRIVDGDPYDSLTNLDDSPLAIEGDMLVERVGDQLWQWDLTTMQRVDAYSLPTRSFTVLPDRSIVTWGQDTPGEARCTLFRLVGGALTKYTTLVCVGAGEMLRRTGTSDAIYVVYDDRVVRFRFAGTKLDDDASFSLPPRNPSSSAQITSLEDGRLVFVGRDHGITIVAPDAQPIVRPTKYQPRHLARAANGYWYSYAATNNYRHVDTVVLAGTRDTIIPFAPARIVHMASHGDTLALLLMTGPEEWHVALVEAGRERWRARVPTKSARQMYAAAVGVSATRLVLHSSTGLRAWNTATGEILEVANP